MSSKKRFLVLVTHLVSSQLPAGPSLRGGVEGGIFAEVDSVIKYLVVLSGILTYEAFHEESEERCFVMWRQC